MPVTDDSAMPFDLSQPLDETTFTRGAHPRFAG